MTDAEILCRWKWRGNKDRQMIQILADLNAVPYAVMREELVRLGAIGLHEHQKEAVVWTDEMRDRLMRLYNEGWETAMIGDLFKTTSRAIIKQACVACRLSKEKGDGRWVNTRQETLRKIRAEKKKEMKNNDEQQ